MRRPVAWLLAAALLLCRCRAPGALLFGPRRARLDAAAVPYAHAFGPSPTTAPGANPEANPEAPQGPGSAGAAAALREDRSSGRPATALDPPAGGDPAGSEAAAVGGEAADTTTGPGAVDYTTTTADTTTTVTNISTATDGGDPRGGGETPAEGHGSPGAAAAAAGDEAPGSAAAGGDEGPGESAAAAAGGGDPRCRGLAGSVFLAREENGRSPDSSAIRREQYDRLVEMIVCKADGVAWEEDPAWMTLYIHEPRESMVPMLQRVLCNAANVYGGEPSVGLTVHTHERVAQRMRERLPHFRGVQWRTNEAAGGRTRTPVGRAGYNAMMMQPAFYKSFGSKFVFIFQTDGFFLRKIPENMFKYACVGSPWVYSPWDKGEYHCGNGGMQLRDVQVHAEVAEKHPARGENEDIYFNRIIPRELKPHKSESCRVAVETIYCERDTATPSFVHAPYKVIWWGWPELYEHLWKSLLADGQLGFTC